MRRNYYTSYVSMEDEDNITKEKLDELKGCFGSFDRNGDGTISASEFQNALIRMNIYIPPEEVKGIIDEYDVDGNDSLDFNEFLMLIAKLDPRIGQEIEINKAFKLFDKDSNGYITRAELADALHRFGIRTSDEEEDAIFTLTDDNADEKITHTEFRNMLYDAVPPPGVPLAGIAGVTAVGNKSPRGSRSPSSRSPTPSRQNTLR